ncbi:MAG: DEAD/DEAH box helicase [Flavobacteriales bacterium]
MEQELKELLLGFKNELTYFQSDDILVHLSAEKVLSADELANLDDPKTQRILREAHRIYKELGIQAFCQSIGVLHWEKQGKQVTSPVFLSDVPLSFKKSGIRVETEKEEIFYLNPFVERWLRDTHDSVIPSWENRLELERIFMEEGLDFDAEKCVFGNFHPQRYELLKEVDELLLSDNLSEPIRQLLGHSEVNDLSENWHIKAPFLFPYDPDQANVFDAVNNGSVTVQGPPGTGKSQVISNLIGACVAQNKNVLIVSEKKAALTVLQQKLEQKNLGFLCSHLSFHENLHAFYVDLKASWEFLAQQENNGSALIPVQEEEDKIPQIFNAIKRFESETGMHLDEFQKQFSLSKKKQAIHGAFPSLKTWLNDRMILEQLDASIRSVLPFLHLSWKKSGHFSENQQKFESLFQTWKAFNQIFDLSSISSLQAAMREALICHQFQGQIYEKYGRFLGKDQSVIFKLLKKWRKVSMDLDQQLLEQPYWIQEPSLVELEHLKSLAQHNGFFAQLRWKNTWRKWVRTPELDPFTCIANKEKQLSLVQVKNKIAQSLNELGIQHFDIEIPILEQLLAQNSVDDWHWYQSLNQEQRNQKANANRTLHQIQEDLNALFVFSPTFQFGTILQMTDDALHTFQKEISPIEQLSDESYLLLKQASELDHLQEFICEKIWRQFITDHPYMLDFELASFKQQMKKFILRKEEQAADFATYLIQHHVKKFAHYQNILSAPLAKLSGEEKQLRATLRKGKSILVKEFAKTRQHLSIRELRKSEARFWLDLLKPIQLSNPSSLASIYPMETALFDLLIFDEAGQIPMSYALGALQRAKRVVVAGDHQQMSPSSYFKKTEEQVIDVLHQSAFYFKNILLTRHYRSRHPKLIAYSNQHFYQGRLHTFSEKKPIDQPIQWTFLSNGIFENRNNVEEAKVMAKLIEKALLSKEKYGIVAFSEMQLATIYQCLSSIHQDRLNEAISNDRIFFKALEQVQGEECDHLLISFGYGKNPDGKFDMRFGPLNLINGAKRLNVLFSRARCSIHFVSSVRSADFGQTKNEGVQRLIQWFHFMEHQEKEVSQEIGINETFRGILSSETEFLSFFTRLKVLNQRGWNLF